MSDFDKAWDNLMLELVKALKIKEMVIWLTKKLNKISRRIG